MLNILWPLLAGTCITLSLHFSGLLTLGEAVLPGVLALVAVYYFLARKTFKTVEGIFQSATKSLQTQPPRFDVAIRGLEAAYIPVVDDIVEAIAGSAVPGDVVLIMSNGGFGGIHGKLLNALGRSDPG